MGMLNTMTYKGYAARIEFDTDDNIYFGKVLDANGMISFHGNNLHELRKDFESAIDFYLQTSKHRS